MIQLCCKKYDTINYRELLNNCNRLWFQLIVKIFKFINKESQENQNLKECLEGDYHFFDAECLESNYNFFDVLIDNIMLVLYQNNRFLIYEAKKHNLWYPKAYVEYPLQQKALQNYTPFLNWQAFLQKVVKKTCSMLIIAQLSPCIMLFQEA